MASRKTRPEAEQLKKELEARHPNATIVIEENYREAQVSPYGLGYTYQEEDILRYEGDFPVVGGTSFSIFELTCCYLCKEEMKSSAIGESGSCHKCQSAPSAGKPVSSRPAYGDLEATGHWDAE